MFIFGWGPRETLMDSGQFDCPVCQATTPFQHRRRRRWMTFFFIPVLPISSSQDFIRCQACQSNIPLDALLGESAPPPRLSRQALVGMICGLFSLLTFCVPSLSLPNAFCAIALGHVALRDIHKNRQSVDGRSLAITALGFGYTALILSASIGWRSLFGPQGLAGNDPAGAVAGANIDALDDEAAFGISDSPNEAFKNAEYAIASKRGQPAGRGNSDQAIRLANLFAERIQEVSDEVFASDRKPLLQLSDGEYLTFCELHPDRVLFLVHVPSYRKFTGDAKKALAQLAWLAAQSTAAGQLQGEAKLGVGLRGVLTYGDILLGTAPASSDDAVTPFRAGDKEDLIAFFAAPAASRPNPASPADVDAPLLAETNAAAASPDSLFDPPAPGSHSLAPGLPAADPFAPSPPLPAAQPSLGDVASAKPIASASAARSRPTAKIEFVNQISVERVAAIQTTSWGTTSLALSPDGKWLAAGKLDEKLALFDVASGNAIGQPYALPQSGQVTAVTFSAAGDHLIAGGYGGKTFAWQVTPEGRLTNERENFRFDSEIVALATSPKFAFFMGASRKGTVAWQPFGANQSQPRLMQQFQKEVHAVWLPASGDEALATDGTRLVRFSLRDGAATDSDDLGIRSARLASFSRSGKRLVVADSNTLYLLDLGPVPSPRSIRLPRGEMAYGLRFHPGENWVAVGMRGKVAVYDFERAELIAYADAESVSYQKNLDFSADGTLLAATSESASDSIQVFRLANDTP